RVGSRVPPVRDVTCWRSGAARKGARMVRQIACVVLWVLLLVAFILSGPTVPSAEAQFPQTCSYNPCIIDMSPSTYVIDNQWNVGTATGSQSITVNSGTSWSTAWDWNRPDEWTVTTYASAVTGWHWGWHFSPGQTGFPVQLSSHTPISATVAFDYLPDSSCGALRTCRMDIMYDVWLHNTSNPGSNSNPALEMMIWVAYSRDLWVGYVPVGYATLGGHEWKVFASGSYVAFVINEPDLNGVSLNITDFTDWMVNNLGKPASWWVSSVEFGPEIYKGQGTLNVTSYTVQVGSTAPPPPSDGAITVTSTS